MHRYIKLGPKHTTGVLKQKSSVTDPDGATLHREETAEPNEIFLSLLTNTRAQDTKK